MELRGIDDKLLKIRAAFDTPQFTEVPRNPGAGQWEFYHASSDIHYVYVQIAIKHHYLLNNRP